MNIRFPASILLLTIGALLAGCNDSGGSDTTVVTPPTPEAVALESNLRTALTTAAHTGDPSHGIVPVKPADDAMVKLGQVLFFSRTLSGNFDVACATCHHPKFAGADQLSLAVGVASEDPTHLGPGRRINPAQDRDPRKDCPVGAGYCGPNVPRNSQTTFNVALYQNRLFFDGRVEWLDRDAGQIRSVESGVVPEILAGPSLLNAQSRFPVPNANEMRGFGHIDLTDPNAYRAMIVDRLKGIESDGNDRVSTDDAARWLALFRTAFAEPAGDADTLVTFPNIQRALDAYQTSTTFTDTPWRRYVAGTGALSPTAKRGALLFFRPASAGGLGCAGCHSGNNFTDELTHNTGFPQIGRGKRPDGQDRGREDVDRNTADSFAYRTPGLINIALTAPYGHAGTFQTLEELIDYHVNPNLLKAQLALTNLTQFATMDTALLYPNFNTYTQAALDSPNFNAGNLLPMRDATVTEVAEVAAFLRALTDSCAASQVCTLPWVPARNSSGDLATGDDPDGHLLVIDQPSENDQASAPPPPPPGDPSTTYPSAAVTLNYPVTTALTNFAELSSCSPTANASASNAGTPSFVDSAASSGLDFVHGFLVQTWLADGFSNSMEDTMMAGGLSATYVDGDCWPDLIVAAGENLSPGSPQGLQAYLGSATGNFTRQALSSELAGTRSNGVGLADINGDFRREVFVANLVGGASVFRILAQDNSGDYPVAATLPMYRNTWGMAFGDTNGDGYPEVSMAHWDQVGLPNIAPSMWKNNAGASIQPNDLAAQTGVLAGINQAWQFSPSFADFDDDGFLDLAMVADFKTSTVFRNNGSGVFSNVTNRAVISDENGMGSAIGDYDNDGKLDWFVSSVFDPNGIAEIIWGVTGNRLYRNTSSTGSIQFADVTAATGVANGLWGWAACFADFNNDGWLDIFHENGFGYLPAGLIGQPGATDLISAASFNNVLNIITTATQEFTGTPARLFISNGPALGGVTFTDAAADWGIGGNTNGRGVSCGDFDRDGDVDIAVLQNSGAPKYYVNQVGSGAASHFINVRVVGAPPNTDAIGAKVRVRADTNNSGSIVAGETQLRVSAANSNFNSQNLPDLHFGLGAATVVDALDIEWPDGTTTHCANAPVNRFVVIDQRAPVCP